MKRITILLMLLCGWAKSDTLDGAFLIITNETNVHALSIEGTLNGLASPDTGRTVFVCFDSTTANCQSLAANASIWGTNTDFLLAIPSGYKDGNSHNAYAWLQAVANAGQTQPTTGDLLLLGSPQPFKVVSGILQPRFVPASTSGLRVKPSDICLVYNTNTATDSGFSATFGPWYAAARNIPAANVVAVSLPSSFSNGLHNSLTTTQFTSLLSSINSGCPATAQWIALAWVIPSEVGIDVCTIDSGSNACNSICFAITNNGYQAPTLSQSGLTLLSFGSNPYFNTANATPYTTYGIRPTIMVATTGSAGAGTGSVSLSETMVSVAKSGDYQKPTAVADILLTGDGLRNLRAQAFSTVNLGTVISGSVTVGTPSTNYLTSTANILGYFGGEATYSSFGTSTWVAGAFGDSLTSNNGNTSPTGCNGQTCSTWFTDNGAVGAYGSEEEPYALLQRFPDPALFLSRYTSGMNLIAAAWGSLQENWYGANFFGDPLADPYGTSAPYINAGLGGAASLGGKAGMQ